MFSCGRKGITGFYSKMKILAIFISLPTNFDIRLTTSAILSKMKESGQPNPNTLQVVHGELCTKQAFYNGH